MTEFFGVHELVADMTSLVTAYKNNDIDLDVFVRHFSAGLGLIDSKNTGLFTLAAPFSQLCCLASTQAEQGEYLTFDHSDELAKHIQLIESVLQQPVHGDGS